MLRAAATLTALIVAAQCSSEAPQLLQGALQAHKQGDLPTALRLYDAVVRKLGPDRCPAAVLSNLGAVNLALNRLPAAEAAWHAALAASPGHTEAHLNLAISYQHDQSLSRERLQAAVRHASLAIKQRPNYVKAHHALGNALQSLGDAQGAAAQWALAEAHTEAGKGEAPHRRFGTTREVGERLVRGGMELLVRAGRPLVLQAPGFLSPRECAAIMLQAQQQGMQPSQVLGEGSRRSSTAWLGLDSSPAMQRLRARAAALLGAAEGSLELEALQVVRYSGGGYFGAHHDSSTQFQRRPITILIYLTELDSDQAGHTHFPWAHSTPPGSTLQEVIAAAGAAPPSQGLLLRPEQGLAVVFENLEPETGNPELRAVHAAREVQGEAEKWVANLWLRD